MLSQLNLRFHKKLIEALKVRAGQENTSVNSLAERFLDDGLKTATASDGYFQLIADPEGTVRQLYRHIILGQNTQLSVLPRSPAMSCTLSWHTPERPFCVARAGWPPSRPCARCLTSPGTCWPGSRNMTVLWTPTT